MTTASVSKVASSNKVSLCSVLTLNKCTANTRHDYCGLVGELKELKK